MVKQEASVALCRVSSKKQLEGHSLEAQAESVRTMAEEMQISIEHAWSVSRTSLKGKNHNRKELEEILRYCRKNKHIKYLFVDRVNRLMREMKLLIVYIAQLELIGVKVIFCDPSQRHLNKDDQLSQLLLIIEGFNAEQDNRERQQTSISKMRARVQQGYHIFYPPPGYRKGAIKGITECQMINYLSHSRRLLV